MTEKVRDIPSIGGEVESPDFVQFLSIVNGGNLIELLNQALGETAARVSTYGDEKTKGKVMVELTMTPGKGANALQVAYQIRTLHPTMRGERTEIVRDSTPAWVNRKGALSLRPSDQMNLDFED